MIESQKGYAIQRQEKDRHQNQLRPQTTQLTNVSPYAQIGEKYATYQQEDQRTAQMKAYGTA